LAATIKISVCSEKKLAEIFILKTLAPSSKAFMLYIHSCLLTSQNVINLSYDITIT
jgi:hypothetical protein